MTLSVLYNPPLLMSESRKDFDAVRDAIQQQIMPRDFIEHLFVADLVDGEWEILRLRRDRILIAKMETKSALRSLIILAFGVGDFAYNDYLIERWFTNKAVKKTVLAALGKFGLDEFAIDAEAYRESMEQLEPLDMRLAELEARRDKILRRIEDHRAGLATRVQTNSDRRVHGELVLPRAHQTS